MSLTTALEDWRALLGDEHVRVEEEERRLAETATFPTNSRIPAILQPANAEQVAECLRIASRHRVPIYPVSRGKNWGLGSRVPPTSGSVLMELSRLNRILEVDEELAFITVEPGVTFSQVYELFCKQRSRLFLNSTGGSPESSLIGNALERGDGSGPNGDRLAHVAGLEVVLGDGSVVRTGFERFSGTKLGPLHRWGVGPALDGLFSQSNLGVVTRMTFWLSPLPRSLHAVRFEIDQPTRLGKLVDAFRELRLDGTIRSVVGFWNDYRMLSTEQRHPSPDEGSLSRSRVQELRGSSASWAGLTAIYAASPEQGHAGRLHLERCIQPLVDKLSFVEHSGDARAGRELLAPTEPAFRFLQGIPHEGALRSVYWRKSGVGDPIDPNQDRCGVVWECPALPFRGRDAAKAVAFAERTLLDAGFEPLIAMVAQSERVLYMVPLIIYDRDQPGADEAAETARSELLRGMQSRGYLPYRLGIQSMNDVVPATDSSRDVFARLKRALDPADVLAPGRYDWR